MEADLSAVIETALREDLGPEFTDITTEALVGNESGLALIIANQAGRAAGLDAAGAVFSRLEARARWTPLVDEGAEFAVGETIAEIRASLRTILSGERTALNLLSHLSGIATLTSQYVFAVSGTGARIFDTRKTLPGLRRLEKAAVVAGGGHNHRFGLYDALLIKDNHLVGGDIRAAVELCRRARPGQPVEVEVDTLDQLREVLGVRPEIVLLDNMDEEKVREAVALSKGKVEIEVSGGVSLRNVGTLARAGAERISIGALTQAAAPIDFSLSVVPEEAAP